MKESTQQQVGPEDSALSRGFTLVLRYLLIATSLFHLWTGVMGPLESTLHRSLALSVYLSLLFMLPLYRKPIRSWGSENFWTGIFMSKIILPPRENRVLHCAAGATLGVPFAGECRGGSRTALNKG